MKGLFRVFRVFRGLHPSFDLSRGRICVVGIGNRLRGDDGAGPAVVRLLSSAERMLCIDAGSAPENYAERIAGFAPDHVLLVDAADFGGQPGEVRLLSASDIEGSGLSCHASSLSLLARYLEARTACHIHLLAIQPVSTGFMCPLSPPMEEAVRACAQVLRSALRSLSSEAGPAMLGLT